VKVIATICESVSLIISGLGVIILINILKEIKDEIRYIHYRIDNIELYISNLTEGSEE
jgi:hypothetical protein